MSEFNSLRAFMDADGRLLREQAKKQASDEFSRVIAPGSKDFPPAPNMRTHTEQLSPVTPPHLDLYYPSRDYQTSYRLQESDSYTTGDYQLRDYQQGNTPASWQMREQSSGLQTENYQHLPAPLPASTAISTQSLVLALQATMTPKNGRTPVVIPGSRRRTRNLQTLPDTDSFQFNAPTKMRHHWRHIIAICSTLVIVVFTLLSLSPLGTNQSGVVVFDNAIKWSQSDQQNWDLAIERANNMTPVKQPTTNGSTTTPAAPSIPSIDNNPNLPHNSYVTLAEQDAIKYGISPVYFVNQIQQESGFDPYAQSPAGAVGIAQFEPATAAAMGVNPYDPVSALDGAARFMASLSEEFNGNYAMALAAYNAGPGAVQNAEQSCGNAWLSCLPAETQSYVSIIMG
jgi:hypothetical protein